MNLANRRVLHVLREALSNPAFEAMMIVAPKWVTQQPSWKLCRASSIEASLACEPRRPLQRCVEEPVMESDQAYRFVMLAP